MKNHIKFFYHLNSYKFFLCFFILAFTCQIFFWKKTENFKSTIDIIPDAPNQYLTSALSFGDKEFLFRILSFRLQNSGDVFAGFVSLKNYDYKKIYDWLIMLDSLNNKSHFPPALASYYYSQTQKTEDNRYIVDYLEKNSENYPEEKWWWLLQAVMISKNSLNDLDLALRLSYKLSEIKTAPLWAKEMPAFIYEKMGDGCMAFKVIEKLIAESNNGQIQATTEQTQFMHYFIKERLAKLKSQKFDPRKCL